MSKHKNISNKKKNSIAKEFNKEITNALAGKDDIDIDTSGINSDDNDNTVVNSQEVESSDTSNEAEPSDKGPASDSQNPDEEHIPLFGKKRTKHIYNKYFLWGLTGFLTVLACIILYFIINNTDKIGKLFASINKIMMPVFIAMVIAYLLAPILNFIEKKMIRPLFRKMKIKDSKQTDKAVRGLGIFLTLLLVLAFIIGLTFVMISQIVPSFTKLTGSYATYVSDFQTWVKTTLGKNTTLVNIFIDVSGTSSEQLESYITDDLWSNISKFLPFINADGSINWDLMQEYIRTIIGGVGRAFSTIWNSILGLMISVYLLAGKEKFSGRSKKLTYSIFPRKTANELIYDVRFAHKTFIGFFGGKVIDSIIVAILCFIGTTIMRTPYAALVSVFVGITNIIPYFGPFIGAIPSTLLIFLVDPTHPWKALMFVIFILVLQQIDGNFIGPKILGDSTGLEGFWVIFAITVFGGIFGIPGMIIGVPLFAIIYAGLRALAARSLRKKKLLTESEDYIDIEYIDEDGTIHRFDYEAIEREKKNKKNDKEWFVVKIVKGIKHKIDNKKKKSK